MSVCPEHSKLASGSNRWADASLTSHEYPLGWQASTVNVLSYSRLRFQSANGDTRSLGGLQDVNFWVVLVYGSI